MSIIKRFASEDYVSTTVNENSLPMPATAAAGQFIVVSAVDDNGKVTATDAITLEDAEGVGF